MNFLLHLDHATLLWINHGMNSPWLDWFFVGVTNLHKLAVVRWGLFPLLLVFWFYKQRSKMFPVLLAVGLTIAVSDTLCYRLIKQETYRPRPALQGMSVILPLHGTPHSSSFPSDHATNSFAAASVLAWFFPVAGWFFYLFAAVIAFSRLYLGVHFPSDVLAGALFGLVIAEVLKRFLFSRFPFFKRSRRVVGEKLDNA